MTIRERSAGAKRDCVGLVPSEGLHAGPFEKLPLGLMEIRA